jgi:hypothetical protein
VNISDELFDCFIDMIALTNEATDIIYPNQWASPRLKNGSENYWNNCVIQSLVHVLQDFYAPSASYEINAIHNWISANNYYEYSYQYEMWGVNIPAVLNHFLEGGYIRKSDLPETSTGSSQYIIVLRGPPAHVVVFTGRNSGMINYYDHQNGCAGQCLMSDIANIYKATGYCVYN